MNFKIIKNTLITRFLKKRKNIFYFLIRFISQGFRGVFPGEITKRSGKVVKDVSLFCNCFAGNLKAQKTSSQQAKRYGLVTRG
ncbi:hypothetical protein [Cronobacter dublinensis]|uniref:hypothetical protein n=1 Tax=Cronobacter dublinensis TaxID=413497 RepID=UPI000CFDB394|nr:hypothetical protein [Cronobacter dublinensis]